jgi:hypothetical protein
MKSQIELHSHIYLDRYGLEKVVEVMDHNGLNVVAPLYLNAQSFEDLKRAAEAIRKFGYVPEADDLAIRIERDGKRYFLLRGAELDTSKEEYKPNFHIITLGYDGVRPLQPIRTMIDDALSHDAFVIWDHPLVNNSNAAKQTPDHLVPAMKHLCRAYSGKLALEWNGYCIPWVRKALGGRDVNKEVIDLSVNLATEGSNNPVVTDTDLHARTAFALKVLGTARIKTDLDLTAGRTIIDSLKRNVFSLNYENTYQTVPLWHFVPCWGVPYALEKFAGISLHKPRG